MQKHDKCDEQVNKAHGTYSCSIIRVATEHLNGITFQKR